MISVDLVAHIEVLAANFQLQCWFVLMWSRNVSSQGQNAYRRTPPPSSD